MEDIENNYKSLKLDISIIDADLTETIKNAQYTTIIVDNDMFKFLEKYGLRVISLENNDNYSLNTFEEAKKLIKEKQVKYIYCLNEKSNSIVNELIKQVGGEIVVINGMYSVDGGITNTNDNYLTIMKSNISLIERELYK